MHRLSRKCARLVAPTISGYTSLVSKLEGEPFHPGLSGVLRDADGRTFPAICRKTPLLPFLHRFFEFGLEFLQTRSNRHPGLASIVHTARAGEILTFLQIAENTLVFPAICRKTPLLPFLHRSFEYGLEFMQTDSNRHPGLLYAFPPHFDASYGPGERKIHFPANCRKNAPPEGSGLPHYLQRSKKIDLPGADSTGLVFRAVI